MKKTVGVVLRVRMSSTRLPDKALLPLDQQPMLAFLIERIRLAKEIDLITVATSRNEKDDAIAELCRNLEIPCFRGDEDDVLDRVAAAAEAFGIDIVVHLMGDNPLLDPAIIDLAIKAFQDSGCDYLDTNLNNEYYPRGTGVQVFARDKLAEINRLTDDPADHEHVTLHFREHPDKYLILTVPPPPELNRPDLRLNVDTVEDYKLVSEVYRRLYPVNKRFTLLDVIECVDENNLSELNRHIQPKPVR